MSLVKRPLKGLMLVLLGGVLSWSALAAGEGEPRLQRDEPIYIESDSLSIDDIKGVSTYQGNVQFRQGTALLRAESLVIHSRDRQELDKIVAKGKPAHFEHHSAEPGKDASGEARRIEYVAQKALVILDGEAHFRQGDNQFAGNRIEYDADKKVVRAGKSVAPEGQGRVRIVIQPRSTTPETDAPKAEQP